MATSKQGVVRNREDVPVDESTGGFSHVYKSDKLDGEDGMTSRGLVVESGGCHMAVPDAQLQDQHSLIHICYLHLLKSCTYNTNST